MSSIPSINNGDTNWDLPDPKQLRKASADNSANYILDKLESFLPGTRDGKVNKAESQQAYDTLLAQASDQIPQAIKDRFKDGQAFADQFDKIDALGVADGYVDQEEFSKFLLSEGDTSTSGASAEEPQKPEASASSAAEQLPKPGPGNSGSNSPANKPEPASGDD